MTTTIFDMRGIRWAAVAVALLLGACDSSGHRSNATTKTNEPTSTGPGFGTNAPTKPEQTYTAEELEKLLVPPSAVPSGFSVRPPDENDETKVCDEDAFPRAQGTPRAEVSYLSGQAAPVLAEELTSYASANEAASVMENARATFKRCKAFDETAVDGTVTHYVVAPMSFDRLADDQAAFRLTFKAKSVTGTSDFVAARVGSLIMLIAGLSATSIPGSGLEPGDFASFAKTAYERIT